MVSTAREFQPVKSYCTGFELELDADVRVVQNLWTIVLQ